MEQYDHGGDIYSDDKNLLDFSVNINPLGMPESVKQAIISNVDKYTDYPDPYCRELRSNLAKRQDVEMEMVVCGNGAAELIFSLCACIRPRKAIILAPTFSEYQRAVNLFGGKVLEHHLLESENFQLTETIMPKLTPDVDMLFLCNPNNPTGQLIDEELLNKIAETCLRNNIMLVLDECFIDFAEDRSMLDQLEKYPNLLILQAFTKIYAMAGLRLGTLYCADLALLSRIAEISPTWNVSGVAQVAGIAALNEEGWVDKTLKIVETEKIFLTDSLRAMGLTVYPSQSNYLLVKSKKELYLPLRERGKLVRSCSNFTGLDKGYIRIAIKTHDKNKVLISALQEVLNG